MANSAESIAQQLVRRVTDQFGLAILTGVASSSFLFFGSLGLALDGTFPATITKSERVKKGISDASALKLWEWMCHRLKVRFAIASLLSGISYLVAGALRPDSRPLLYTASLLSFSVAPYTMVMLLPINKEILKMAKDVSKSDAKSPEPAIIDRVFGEWGKYNSIRLLIAAATWGLGTVALLLA